MASSDQKLLEDGKTVSQRWTITLNPEKNSKDKFTVKDVMTDSNKAVNGDLHYTTKALLKEGFAALSKDGIDYSFKCYDAFDNEITDDDDTSHVVKFELTIEPKTTWSGDAVNVEYKSLFSVESLNDGETISVKNTASVGDVSHDADASYTKKKKLIKYIGEKSDDGTYYIWHSGSWNVDFNKTQGNLTYRILVLPDSTNELTVTDVIPEGLLLNAKDVVVEFSTADNSHQYSEEEGGYDITAEANRPEIIVDGQNLTVKIKGGFPQKIVKQGLGFAIDYTVSITDEFWKQLKNSEKTYKNIATWNERIESQETTIKRHVPTLAKDGEQPVDENGEPLNKVKYYVIINAAGKTLNGGKPLTLTDNLKADGVDVALQTENVKLYSYDSARADNHYKDQELSASAFQFKYDEAKKQFTAIVPDGTPCVLEYVYEVENMNNKSQVTLSNSASLSGVDESTVTNSVVVKEASSSAWVKKADQLQLVKVDADRYQITLQNAEFQVEKYENENWTNVEGTYRTGENGTCIISLKKLDRSCLYSVKETKAPDGYTQSDARYYFVALREDQKADDWWNQNQQLVSALSISKNDITFVEYSGFKELYIPNKASSLKVTKLWRNPDGSPAKDTKDVTVQLYQNTTKKEFYTVTVQFVGKNGDGAAWGLIKELQVRPNTRVTLNAKTWETIKVNGSLISGSSGKWKYVSDPITESCTIQVGFGYYGYNVEEFEYIYSSAEYVIDTSMKYGEPVTLTSANRYIAKWDRLPIIDANGSPVYYTVKEVSNLGGYTVSYLNNDGIQSGEITIINKQNEEVITLPETGGTGTYWYTMGGVLLTAWAAFLIYKKHMQKGGKRIW